MAVTQRRYRRETDFDTVSDFLVQHYLPKNRDGNCFQAIWEYSYYHPSTDLSLLATDPDYRKMGLASAAVPESIRRCAEEGANVACVWSIGSSLLIPQIRAAIFLNN